MNTGPLKHCLKATACRRAVKYFSAAALQTVAATTLHASVNLTSSFFCSIESDKLAKRLSRFTPKWTASVTCLAELSATNEKHVASTNKKKMFSRRRIPNWKKNSFRHLQKDWGGKSWAFNVQPNERGRLRTGSKYQGEGRISGCDFCRS